MIYTLKLTLLALSTTAITLAHPFYQHRPLYRQHQAELCSSLYNTHTKHPYILSPASIIDQALCLVGHSGPPIEIDADQSFGVKQLHLRTEADPAVSPIIRWHAGTARVVETWESKPNKLGSVIVVNASDASTTVATSGTLEDPNVSTEAQTAAEREQHLVKKRSVDRQYLPGPVAGVPARVERNPPLSLPTVSIETPANLNSQVSTAPDSHATPEVDCNCDCDFDSDSDSASD